MQKGLVLACEGSGNALTFFLKESFGKTVLQGLDTRQVIPGIAITIADIWVPVA
jgi:hypothetical protein